MDDRLIAQLKNSRKAALSQVISAIGIPGIGEVDAGKISDAFCGSKDVMKSAILDGFRTVRLPDYPELRSAFRNIEFREEVLCLLDELEISQSSVTVPSTSSSPASATMPAPLTGLNFVVTGTLRNYSRNEIEAEISRYGGNFQKAITRMTSYVLCGEKTGATKFNKACQQGIPVIYENDFLKMIGKL